MDNILFWIRIIVHIHGSIFKLYHWFIIGDFCLIYLFILNFFYARHSIASHSHTKSMQQFHENKRHFHYENWICWHFAIYSSDKIWIEFNVNAAFAQFYNCNRNIVTSALFYFSFIFFFDKSPKERKTNATFNLCKHIK